MLSPEEHALVESIADEVEALSAAGTFDSAGEMLEARARALAPGDAGRAAWFSHAGESWELADHLPRARSCYEEAMADGGPAWLDPRASLVGVLLKQGEEATADELLDELRRDVIRGRTVGPVHDFVGESLEDAGRLEEALRWFTAGVTRSDGGTDDVYGCLSGRFRVRRALGLPFDSYDELAERRRTGAVADLPDDDEPFDEPALLDPRAPAPIPVTALYWPPDEFEVLLAHWPEFEEDYGTHEEHRANVERMLRGLSEQGAARLSIGPGSVKGFKAYVAERGKDPLSSDARSSYAAELSSTGQHTPWPPARNAPCWCGSGGKYKKCCGAPQ